ncbi:hypothetical protein E2562_006098 [Oryza meyeriana var. granulata]|uniref:Uncharacterized protein n=1 Tax=Oryza meyeriana var. granulata TaxID=110450 RepID=A0A6G1EVK4_9ORYZ|nr:hypothetical protein E2562_006098 [Oryza meyeriana var. granulata]KAF0928666.1 hypothetical protein E2562_006098 [Oryza meyeriana var. granulata]
MATIAMHPTCVLIKDKGMGGEADCLRRGGCGISLSNEKYQVIKPPGGFDQTEDLYLGQSEKGVYCASFNHIGGVCIYILNESCGEMDWAFKHLCGLWPILECGRIDGCGSWTLQEYEEDGGNEATVNGESEATVEAKFDWDSDNGDVIVPGPRNYHCGDNRVSFLGFHPYKEVVFLSENFSQGLTYHLNSSKIQTWVISAQKDMNHMWK